MLALQVPAAREYFLSYRLVLQMLDDGFDVAAWLHDRGIAANVWTLDYRTHFIPPETPVSDLGELKTWTDDVFESDIDAAVSRILEGAHRQSQSNRDPCDRPLLLPFDLLPRAGWSALRDRDRWPWFRGG